LSIDSNGNNRDDGGDDDDGPVVVEDSINEQIVKGHDLIPIDLAQFLVTTGVSLYLKMLLVDNLMHADLHPGNIMITAMHDHHHSTNLNSKDSLVPAQEQLQAAQEQFKGARFAVSLVDAGMVAQLTDSESSIFIGLLSSIGEGDGKTAAAYALLFSLENHMPEEAKNAFTNEMVQLFSESCRGYGTHVDVGNVLRSVLGLIRKHKVRIDANYATLVVNCLCIESLARQVCPSYNVLDAARPLLQSYRRLCYNDDGSPKVGAQKTKYVKVWLSLMYAQKNLSDNAFFRRESRQSLGNAIYT
jgi:aarF domain-containing kinase